MPTCGKRRSTALPLLRDFNSSTFEFNVSTSGAMHRVVLVGYVTKTALVKLSSVRVEAPVNA
jgi:hypothetical protein